MREKEHRGRMLQKFAAKLHAARTFPLSHRRQSRARIPPARACFILSRARLFIHARSPACFIIPLKCAVKHSPTRARPGGLFLFFYLCGGGCTRHRGIMDFPRPRVSVMRLLAEVYALVVKPSLVRENARVHWIRLMGLRGVLAVVR